MKRLPALLSLLMFIALCASIAYWLLQWLAPAPRPVAAPPVVQQAMPPLSAAANLFGSSAQSGATAIQLRGIIHSGRGSDSVAIVAVEGKPPRALRARSEILPGIELKEIRARTVILSERGGDREVMLPEFSTLAVATQTGMEAAAAAQPEAQMPPPAQSAAPLPSATPAQAPPSPPPAPATQAAQSTAQSTAQGAPQGALSSGPGNTGTAAAGRENPLTAPPAARPLR